MNQKYWEVLLKSWRKHGKQGLTIPYIIGAQKYLPAKHNEQSIGDLILDIAHNAVPAIYITYCTDINDLILGVRDESKEKIAGYFPLFKDSPQNGFYVTNIANDLGDTIEKNISNLSEKYQAYIADKKFSKNSTGCGDYSVDEINFICSCFENY